MSLARNRPAILPAILVAIGFALAPLLYSVYTHHVWEDFLITFRYSQNLVNGHGLVYYPGRRIYGFTSSLGMLIPAFFYWITGAGNSFIQALDLFRLLSAAAFGAAGVLLIRRTWMPGRWTIACAIFAALLYVFEAKSVIFSANGQEQALMLFFLAWAVMFIDRDIGQSWPWLGLAWAGLEWTRPDGVIYMLALGCGIVLFTQFPRRRIFVALIKAGLLAAAIYLPWVIFTWIYYGSPIPQTVIAKSVWSARLTDSHSLVSILEALWHRLAGNARMIYMPIYASKSDWPLPVRLASDILVAWGALYWLAPTKDRVGRSASAAMAIICLYFATMVDFFPWYAPPAAFLGLIVIVRSVGLLLQKLNRPARIVLAAVACAIVFECGYVMIQSARQMKVQQAVIEDGVRAPIGLYIKSHGHPGDTVLLEPFGYIGFFSNADIRDWPGLVAPEVTNLLRRPSGRSFAQAIRPTWIVLRPGELKLFVNDPYFEKHYKLAALFDATNDLKPYANLPGQDYLHFDSRYFVYRQIQPVAHSNSSRLLTSSSK